MAPNDAAKAAEPEAPRRLHKATFATDKRNPGNYLIRVMGPTADAFIGREVPVTRKDNTESVEKLAGIVWVGVDDETGQRVALYRFESKPREEVAIDDLPF